MAFGLGPQLAARESVAYRAKARDAFQTGDLLCFRGRGWLSAAIRLVTKSEYSHVGLVYLFEGRVYCMEAVGSGVRLILMSELVRHYDGGIDWFELRDAPVASRASALGFAFAQLGKRYDTRGILRFLWAKLMGNIPRTRDQDEWFCSELAAAAWDRAGVPLVPQPWPPDYVSPAMLANSEQVTFRSRIKAD
jgi:hypothetical protein